MNYCSVDQNRVLRKYIPLHITANVRAQPAQFFVTFSWEVIQLKNWYAIQTFFLKRRESV